MGIKGYLTEKSVLEIFDARPGADTPARASAALSRGLAAKYHISTKTIQQIWNRKSWTDVTNARLRNAVDVPSVVVNGSNALQDGSGAGFSGLSGFESGHQPSNCQEAGGEQAKRREREDEDGNGAITKRRRRQEGLHVDTAASDLAAGKTGGQPAIAAFSSSLPHAFPPSASPSLPLSFLLPPSLLPTARDTQSQSLSLALALSHLSQLNQLPVPSLPFSFPQLHSFPCLPLPSHSSFAANSFDSTAAASPALDVNALLAWKNSFPLHPSVAPALSSSLAPALPPFRPPS